MGGQGCLVVQLIAHLTQEPEVPGGIPGSATFVPPSADSRRAVVSYWRKYVYKVLINSFVGINLPRNCVVRLTDHSTTTIPIYCGCKATKQQQQQYYIQRNNIVLSTVFIVT